MSKDTTITVTLTEAQVRQTATSLGLILTPVKRTRRIGELDYGSYFVYGEGGEIYRLVYFNGPAAVGPGNTVFSLDFDTEVFPVNAYLVRRDN